MANLACVGTDAVPHHIIQRGADGQDVFLASEDRQFYLDTLHIKCEQYGLALLGYCLMPNHIHLVAEPARADSIGQALGQTNGRYSRWFTERYGYKKRLWASRHASFAIERTDVVDALTHVDLNPVRAAIVESAVDYEWSSARAHALGVDASCLLDEAAWRALGLAAKRSASSVA